LSDIASSDTRYTQFTAFRKRRVFNNTRRRQADGANDFWEGGVLNPDLILADLVKIFHPELLPDHNLYYLERLE
jgi:iron complex transport system substrate-binding protein